MTIHIVVSVLAAVSAFCGAVSAILYVPARRKATQIYAELQKAEGDQIKPVEGVYRAADQKHKRLAVTVMITFAFTYIVLSFFGNNQTTLDLVSMSAVFLSIIIFPVTASHFNSKDMDLARDAEDERLRRSYPDSACKMML